MIDSSDDPYLQILDHDIREYRSCSFHWDCENCTRSLCISLVGGAELPSLYGHFRILGFANNKDQKDHVAVVKGEVSGKAAYSPGFTPRASQATRWAP